MNLLALGGAAGLLALLYLASRLSVRRYGVYFLALAFGVWAATLASGIHATVAGILVALTVPVRSGMEPEPGTFLTTLRGRLDTLERGYELSRVSMVRDAEQMEIIEEIGAAALDFLPNGFAMERYLHPVTAFLVLPLFALFNAGVRLDGRIQEALLQPVSLGILLGLCFGKPIGITLTSFVAVKTGQAELPAGGDAGAACSARASSAASGSPCRSSSPDWPSRARRCCRPRSWGTWQPRRFPGWSASRC